MIFNVSIYDFHLMVKYLANIFDLTCFHCLEENTEKYIIFFVVFDRQFIEKKKELLNSN